MNVVVMNIRLTRAQEAFYLLGLPDSTKVHIKILDATLFVNQIELKHLFFYLTLVFWV